jgi:hypothetical protein
MKKQLLILFSLAHINLYAMDVIKPNPFLFYKIPTDVLDHIASFLIFDDSETEAEFIERTQAITTQKLPIKYFAYLPEKNCILSEILCSQYCPNNKIIAVLQRLEPNGYNTSTLTVINTKNDTIVYEQKENLNNCFDIAVSCNGTMIALLSILENEISKEKDFTSCYKELLTIKNINTHVEQIINIPYTFILRSDHPAIAFNKQGTHIITHGLNAKKSNFDPHIIFPITVNTPTDDQNKKTLAKYFMQKFICKNLLK